MRIFRHIGHIGDLKSVAGCAAVYSSFDGLHLGHSRLLSELTASGAGARVVVFDDRRSQTQRLASRRRCFREFDEAGVDIVAMIRGADAGALALQALDPALILVGGGESVDSEILALPMVREVDAVTAAGAPVAAARVRGAVLAGDFASAAAMLGRPYSVDGRVVHGFHRGATIGVPTANLCVRDLLLPPDGVYAVTVDSEAHRGVGVANLGTNPTFGNDARSLETHIFDFEGDLYGARLEVGFIERLRGEKKFGGVDELVAQIRRDVEAARAIHQRR